MFLFLSCIQSGDSNLSDDTTIEDTAAISDSQDTFTETQDTSHQDTSTESVFTLEYIVEPAINGGLALTSNLPLQYDQCIQLEAIDAPCHDEDQDGLTDMFEALILQHMRPIMRLDEGEDFLSDFEGVLSFIGRVTPTQEWIDVFIVLAWSKDYGRCGLSAHHGDSERVALRLSTQGDSVQGHTVSFHQVYTAAHEGEVTDASAIWQVDQLSGLTLEQDPASGYMHWVVFPSEDKHASFASIDACENSSVVPCLDEDCAPDNVPNPQDFDLLPDIVNVGEEQAPFISDLSDIGFPGDHAWLDQDFCGGLTREGCSSPIREKLLFNPFE